MQMQCNFVAWNTCTKHQFHVLWNTVNTTKISSRRGLRLPTIVGLRKLQRLPFHNYIKISAVGSFVCSQCTHVTDRRTDRISTAMTVLGILPVKYEYAPQQLQMRGTILRQHPPEKPIVSCFSSFRQLHSKRGQVVTDVVLPSGTWSTLRRLLKHNSVSISRLIHSHRVGEWVSSLRQIDYPLQAFLRNGLIDYFSSFYGL